MSTLDVWGLNDVAESTYRSLLRNPDFDLDQLAHHLELDVDDVAAAVDALLGLGLLARTPAGLAPASPATTLAALVHSELADLEERRSRLDAVRASLAGFAADHMVGQSRAWSSVPFELLSRDESFAAVEDIQRGTTGEVLSCHRVVDLSVDSPTYVDLVERQLAAGRPMRGLYPAEVLGDPARLAYVTGWAGAGETVRLMTHDLPAIGVFGSEVALVSATWGVESAGTLLLRAPSLVALVRDLFDQYWSRASPLRTSSPRGDAADPANPDDEEARRVLELLQLGLKDESIARQLGVSLRTVRRRVAAVMDDLGATTRFQAGMEAVRRGLI
jgi:DNA-binding CsgD family transcriptional regulator